MIMRKKLAIGAITVLTLVGSMGIPVSAASQDIEVIVDNKVIEFDVTPTIVEGRTLVPLRGIFESLNITPRWDGQNRRVLVDGNGVNMVLPIDSNKAVINNKSIDLDVPATIVNDRTMVPARFISEACGADVSWNNDSRTVTIKSNLPNSEGGSEHSGSEGGESGESGEGGEESGTRYALNDTFDTVRKGARLVMKFDPSSNSFKGTVSNTTNTTLTRVRIEIHLDNGIELGPTTPVDLRAGGKLDIEMKASRLGFNSWTPHAEVGNSEGTKETSGEGSEGGPEGGEGKSEGSESSRGEGKGSEGSENHGSEGSEGGRD